MNKIFRSHLVCFQTFIHAVSKNVSSGDSISRTDRGKGNVRSKSFSYFVCIAWEEREDLRRRFDNEKSLIRHF